QKRGCGACSNIANFEVITVDSISGRPKSTHIERQSAYRAARTRNVNVKFTGRARGADAYIAIALDPHVFSKCAAAAVAKGNVGSANVGMYLEQTALYAETVRSGAVWP